MLADCARQNWHEASRRADRLNRERNDIEEELDELDRQVCILDEDNAATLAPRVRYLTRRLAFLDGCLTDAIRDEATWQISCEGVEDGDLYLTRLAELTSTHSL